MESADDVTLIARVVHLATRETKRRLIMEHLEHKDETQAELNGLTLEDANNILWPEITEKIKAGISSDKISLIVYDGLGLAELAVNETIHPKRVDETQAKLKRLKTYLDNKLIDGVKIKDIIKTLWPTIDKLIKAGRSYQQIGELIYDCMGLTPNEAKRETFWKLVVRHHKPKNKIIAELARKSKMILSRDPRQRVFDFIENQMEDHHDTARTP